MNKKVIYFSLPVVLLAAVGAAILLLAGNSHDGSPANTPEPTAISTPEPTGTIQLTGDILHVDGTKAYEHVAAQTEFGPRPTGSDAWVLTGDYIIGRLKEYGWEVEEQPFNVGPEQAIQARNIIGKLGIGRGPVIILGAHYDTRMVADHDPDPNKRTEPIIGANDGGSGVGVLLELARVLNENYELNNEIWLAFFDAEDNGHVPGWDWILGSTYMAHHLGDTTVAYMILLDMIGDADQNIYYEGNSLQSAPQLVPALWQTAAVLGYGNQFIPESRYSMTDDHLPFIQQGIPAVDIIDFDYPYWHTLGDTLDKVSPDSLERVGRVLEAYWLQSGAIQQKDG